REYGSLLAGQPLGGVLFGLARSAPFLFNAASYLASILTLLFVRSDLRPKSRDTAALASRDPRWPVLVLATTVHPHDILPRDRQRLHLERALSRRDRARQGARSL